LEKNLQAFRRAGVRPIDTKALVSEMVAEKNDRGAVLIGGALVELALRRLVQSRFALPPTETESLFENDAPLSAFHNLARIGYAMGLFDSQIKQDLDRVREIRNLFAHSLHPISFDTPEIAAACSLFQVIPQE
jgi:hypothetical protein